MAENRKKSILKSSIVSFFVFFLLLSGAFSEWGCSRRIEGVRVTGKDEKIFKDLDIMFEKARLAGKKNPDEGITLTSKAIKELEKFDGYELGAGKKSRKESSILVAAYVMLIEYHSAKKDCAGTNEYRVKYEDLTRSKYIVMPMSFIGHSTIFLYGYEKNYKAEKEFQENLFRELITNSMKNCENQK